MKAFVDDLYLWAKSVLETQNLLNRCNTALRWAGMSFRAQKFFPSISWRSRSNKQIFSLRNS